jgi:hypothetical protein
MTIEYVVWGYPQAFGALVLYVIGKALLRRVIK